MLKSLFFPGKVLSSDFLNSSQYYGPAAPGVAFKANPTEFWEYPLLKTSSVDFTDFSSQFVTAQGNSSIQGIKQFSSSPLVPTPNTLDSSAQVANTEYVQNEITSAFLANPLVDLASTQTITGFKTFQNIAVPTTPNFPNSPLSKSFFDSNAVLTSGNQTIAGVKVFAEPVQVPNPINSGDAVNKAVTDILGTSINSLLASVAANTALLSGLTVTQGTYIENTAPCRFFWLKFGGNFKFLIVEGAGSSTDTETIAFPTTAAGFPGFLQPPIVITTAASGDIGLFTPAVSSITAVGFNKAQDRFGGAAGGLVNFLACGV